MSIELKRGKRPKPDLGLEFFCAKVKKITRPTNKHAQGWTLGGPLPKIFRVGVKKNIPMVREVNFLGRFNGEGGIPITPSPQTPIPPNYKVSQGKNVSNICSRFSSTKTYGFLCTIRYVKAGKGKLKKYSQYLRSFNDLLKYLLKYDKWCTWSVIFTGLSYFFKNTKNKPKNILELKSQTI